ncbi:Exodeoxyribonuclease 1 [Erysiphe neolycopersici]|uniref:Exodeoxyribonuclease 1 n=1 Tax=Erysiphe neolycopersici TaxID=212602 RepID=A0A420I1R0_9PEZI|nr:Exodeoxyribonuclease 1 [Erysiphe neolycopersici]
MGISGLLPLLKSIQKACHLKKFEGKTLGVDAYGWLHRGAIACAMELATEKSTRKFVDYALHRVRMLQHFGVIPFLVFDGDNLPSKAETEARRARRREESKKIGIGLLNAGKVSQANAEFQKSLDITPEMARQLIDELKILGVQYIVAPYEADSQMVYLENKGIIHGIISEDSDLLVFGAKCLLTKLDQYGNCTEVNKSDFSACQDINLAGWSDTSFRQMAILSGCDYLASINNMGLKTAYRMIRKYKSIEKVIQMLQFDGKFHVPKGYLESFYKAELTFLYQRVFCPHTLGLVLCTQPSKPINLEDMTYIGAFVEPKIAQGVAKGDLHPMTKAPMTISNSINTPFQRKMWASSSSKQHCVNVIKGVPITTFFKKRAPLVELDSNNFTSLSSPQQTLEKNHKLWTSSPISQSILRQSKVKAYNSPVSSTKNDRCNESSTISEFCSPKRARLCADTDSLTSAESIPLHSSPFFHAKKIKLSSSERKLGDEKKKSSTNIIPNASFTEGVFSISKVTCKTMPEENLGPNSREDEEINYNQKDTTYQNTQTSLVDLEINKPLLQPIPRTDSMKLLPLPDRSNASAYSSHSNEKSALTSSVKTSDSPVKDSCKSAHEQTRISRATQSKNLGGKLNTTKICLTPLQRISISANNRNKTHYSNIKSLPNSRSEEPAIVIHQLVEPLSTRLPTLDDMKNIFLNVSTGSEDLIIYDSEEEPLSPINMEKTMLCPI